MWPKHVAQVVHDGVADTEDEGEHRQAEENEVIYHLNIAQQ